MQAVEPVSTRDATERLAKIIDITYAKAYLQQVADKATHMNSEERTQLLRLPKELEDLFDRTLGDLNTEPVNLEFNPDSKPFNCKYYPVPRINKEPFWREIHRLVKT